METLLQNMDPNKILTLIFNSSTEEVQEEFVERFGKKNCNESFKKAESARRGRAERAKSK